MLLSNCHKTIGRTFLLPHLWDRAPHYLSHALSSSSLTCDIHGETEWIPLLCTSHICPGKGSQPWCNIVTFWNISLVDHIFLLLWFNKLLTILKFIIKWYLYQTMVCVTDQDTLTYPNFCGLCKSLAPEIWSWYLQISNVLFKILNVLFKISNVFLKILIHANLSIAPANSNIVNVSNAKDIVV